MTTAQNHYKITQMTYLRRNLNDLQVKKFEKYPFSR